jgi:heptosyltransferase-2
MKILIVNPLGIGDVIFSTPLIEIVKKSYPESFIGYVCNKRAFEVISTNPYLNKIFVYEKDDYVSAWNCSKIGGLKKISAFLKSIKDERFDVSVDLSLGYKYSMFLKFLGVKRRLGFNYRNRGIFLTDKVDIDGFDDKHVVEYHLDFLKFLNIDRRGFTVRPRVYPGEGHREWVAKFLRDHNVGEKDLVIGMLPGCGASWGAHAEYRRWERKGFARVADRLIEKYGAKIILFGDSKDAEVCEEVQRLMRDEAIMSCGRTSLGEFLHLLTRCALVITNDGGPLHTAAGLGVRTVSIFGPVDEKIYGPYPMGEAHIVISRTDLACRPCYKKFKYHICEARPCLKSIEADEVLKACERMLDKRKGEALVRV